MKKVYLLLALLGIFLSLTIVKAATIGESSVNGVVIQIPTTSSSGGGSGSNVTSVSSGDGCIFVSPTTGDVIITFNSSCATSTPIFNIFDQELNKSYNVTFNNLTVSTNIHATGNISLGNASLIRAGNPQLYAMDNTTTLALTSNNPANAILIQRGSSVSTRLLWTYFSGSIALSQMIVGGVNSLGFVGANSGIYGLGDIFMGTLNSSQTFHADVSNATVSIGRHVDKPAKATLDINGTFYLEGRGDVNGTFNSTYLAGDGSQITNISTIAVVNPNSTTLHCSNITGNGLCPTNSPTFNYVNTTSAININLDGFEDAINIGVFGVPIFRFSIATTLMIIQSLSGTDFTLCNDDCSSQLSLQESGHGYFRNANGVHFDNGFQTYFESNQTRTSINSRDLTFNGTYIEGINVKKVDLNNSNITSQHQTYEITSSTSLDTTYNNTYGRVIYLDVSFQSDAAASDDAWIDFYVNGTKYAWEGQSQRGLGLDIGTYNERHHLGGYVQPNQKWSLNTTISGVGAITLEEVYLTVI